MKTIAVVSLLLVCTFSLSASQIHREVERSSELERELGYRLSVQDKHDVWRAEGLDKVFPISGPSPEYTVRFQADMTGKLKDIFGLSLTLTGADGMVLQVPLALKTKWHRENEVSVEFLIRKDMIDKAALTIRCGLPNLEESYAIRLADHAPKPEKP